MAQLKRVLKWQHYTARNNARHDIVFNLQTLNRESLATAVFNLNEYFVELNTSWGTATTATATYRLASAGSAATAQAGWYSNNPTGGEMTWRPSASTVLQQDNSPYYFHIRVSSTSDFSADLLDWPEGEKGIITVID